MNNIYRHGDLLIKPIKVEKSKLKFLGRQTSFILAEGETTGHRHVLTAEPTTSFNVYEDENGQYILEMEKPANLTHQEHKEITIMPDMYIVGKEREYDYPSENIMQVID